MRGSFSTAFIRDCPMFIIERLYLAVGAIILYCEARAGACSTAHRSNRPDISDGLMLDSRTKWQRLPAGDTLLIAAILFYWITMKVVQQLTCLTLGRPNGPAYSTGELLNTPQGVGERRARAVTCLWVAAKTSRQYFNDAHFISPRADVMRVAIPRCTLLPDERLRNTPRNVSISRKRVSSQQRRTVEYRLSSQSHTAVRGKRHD